MPFEPYRDIDADHDDGDDGGENAGILQLVGNLGSDDLGAAESVAISEHAANLVYHLLIGAGRVHLRLDPDEHAGIGRRLAFATAEILELSFRKPETVDLGSHHPDFYPRACLD